VSSRDRAQRQDEGLVPTCAACSMSAAAHQMARCCGGLFRRGALRQRLVAQKRHLLKRKGTHSLCMRVLTMSSGCTLSVATMPPDSPAMVSTAVGGRERPACLTSGMYLAVKARRGVHP
jgi:hypothetical protein